MEGRMLRKYSVSLFPKENEGTHLINAKMQKDSYGSPYNIPHEYQMTSLWPVLLQWIPNELIILELSEWSVTKCCGITGIITYYVI